MPVLTHKITGQVTRMAEVVYQKLVLQGRADAYLVEKDAAPKMPKEVKNVATPKGEFAQNDDTGTNALLPDGDVREEQ